MKETKGNCWCVMAFGRDRDEARASAVSSGLLPSDMEFKTLSNPLPTGDHWKPIKWAQSCKEKGKTGAIKLKGYKRDFAVAAGEALKTSGVCMEILSVAARKYRDENNLRMERGRVFIFFAENVL